MEKIILNVKKRGNEIAKELRENKLIPAVVYGHGFETTSIIIDNSSFLKAHRIAGESHPIELNIEGKRVNVLVHEIQNHPVSGEYSHIDFLVLVAGEKVHTHIKLHLIGESEAQKQGATIEQSLHSIEVKCTPENLIDSFEVDISKLEKSGDVLHVSQIGINESKYDILVPLDAPVVSAHEHKVSEETVEAPIEAKAETKE